MALSGSQRVEASARPLRFGPGGRFELRPAEYRLLVDGEPAALGGRALDLLIVLAARPHQLLTKSELLESVWHGLVVEENNLRVQVNALRRLLGEDAIATVPGRGYRLSAALHDAAEASAPAASPPAAPVPPGAATPRLFGRAADLVRLETLLQEAGGCVTLVGTPGVGKSSLARAASARWPGRGAWVDLAPLSHADHVAGALARALGAPFDDGGDPVARLRRLLPADGPPLLLVLDNAEHLIETCAGWVAPLAGAPGLRWLVTSQLPLAVGGEKLLRLEPLDVTAGAEHDGALALLVERIRAADGRFQFTPEALSLLAALCRQLDGLPLALEMAAARVPLMGVKAVHDALAERFALLSRGRRDSPARHRTLQDALAWSYGLLAPAEQGLFRSLGVFAGGFTLDLAVTANGDEHVGRWDIVDGLAALVERSLVGVSGDDPPRYRLLETMRAYALEKLGDERASARRRHAAAVLALFLRSESEAECLAEMENVREAFLWAREHDLPVAVQLSARVARIIGFTVWRQEVTDWMLSLQPAMQQPAGQALPLPLQATWWSRMAYVLLVRRDRAGAAAAKQAVALWRRLNDPAELLAALGDRVRSITEAGPELDEACAELQQAAVAGAPSLRAELRVHGALAEAARVRTDHTALLACRENELRLARAIGWNDMAQAAETNICAALIELGRHAEAAARARSLLQRIDAADDDDGSNGNLPWALYMLGEALLPLRAFDEARALVPRLLAAERRFGTRMAWPWVLALVAAQERWPAAARLLGYVSGLRAARQDSPDLGEQQTLDRIAADVLNALGNETAAALDAEGRSLDDATADALAARAND